MTKRQQLNMRVDDVTISFIDQLSKTTGFNKSEIVRMAVYSFAKDVLGSDQFNKTIIDSFGEIPEK